ncbi:M13 family metallopeptidase [Sphingosinicella ginsenosidimutans]|uniref:M13 family metallopeptidase n=2 Tax=Allosphingosinicella ginsenosidimutans TaxID=1176539 RepID=A0A5C6TX98_9SPHN|nr:M13 family metallopeptidase [Sphingosinicella ginsenosidimutans]
MKHVLFLAGAATIALAPLSAQAATGAATAATATGAAAAATATGTAAATAATAGRPEYGDFGIDLSARDLSVRPGDDFWSYANAGFVRAHPIPADRVSYGVSDVLQDQIEQQLKDIVEHPGDDAAARQVADFYASWMDEAGVERRGAAVLQPYLDRINAVHDRAGLIALFATPGFASPVDIGIIPDPADTTRYVVTASQSGLGLPGHDYYLNQGADYDRYRAAYRAYLIQIQTLAGIPDAAAKADAVIALEHRMAEVQWAPERSRDIQQTYNPMDRAQLATLAPQFDWPNMLAAAGLGSAQTVVVGETSAIHDTGALLESVPLETWKAYLTVHFIDNFAQYLPRAFDQANFEFRSHTLRGVEQQRDRWKRGLSVLNRSLGEAVGRIYVERHFPPESRRQITELVGNLRAALNERLRANQWMDDTTREQAIAKLDAFDPRLGSPAQFVDYSPIRVDRADLLGNAVRAGQFAWERQVRRFGGPVDRSLWEMTPQTINAYYDPLMNQITFPAAILQPPYFDPNADPAVNYGAIGAVIGHEIGHGFDDQGSHFDAQGRIRDWWTPQSSQRFAERTQALGAQYNQFEPLPGLHVNGQLTMGENIGDLGGIEMAWSAYRRYVAQHGELPVIDGLTGDQRFFLAYAQSWRDYWREGLLREVVLTNPHAPSMYRVNGVVRNVDEWYRAFNIQPGDRLYLPPEQRVHIW